MNFEQRRIRDLPDDALAAMLREGRFGLKTGPLTFRIKTREIIIAKNIRLLYKDHEAVDSPAFSDFHVSVERPRSVRRWIAPQVEFQFDGYAPFSSLPASQAFAMLEWGMNWCIASTCHQYLLLHAAVLAKEGRAIVMPAAPGSGKSTLSAHLALSGWRLLSDELALIDLAKPLVYGLARPINLKNDSIEIIRATHCQAQINEAVPDTKKGAVAHMAAPTDAVFAQHAPAEIAWLLFPQFRGGTGCTSEQLPPNASMAAIIRNAFNYEVLGERGFEAAARVARVASSFRLQYGTLDEASRWISRQLA